MIGASHVLGRQSRGSARHAAWERAALYGLERQGTRCSLSGYSSDERVEVGGNISAGSTAPPERGPLRALPPMVALACSPWR